MTARHARTTAPISVVLYVRLSVDKSGEGAGVARQESSGRLLAKAKGWKVAAVYSDNDASATSKKPRENFERMLVDIAAGKVRAVICWHLDRLVRKMSDLVRIIDAGKDHGLNIATVHGVSLDMGDPTGIAVAQILTAIAGMEVAHKGARQAAGNAQRANSGRMTTTRCFGYNSDGTVREAEAVYVKDLFTRFVAGATVNALAVSMSGTGMKGATGRARADGRWSRSGIRALLLNRRYLGEVWYQGEFVRMGEWVPLIDPDTFAAAGARLADPTRSTTTGPNRKFLGPGLFRCGICAEQRIRNTVISTNSQWVKPDGERVKYHYYRCEVSTHLNRRMEPVDEFVKDVIVAKLRSPEIRRSIGADRNVEEVRRLRDKANELRRKEDAYALDQVSPDPEFTSRQVKVMTAALHQQLSEIEGTLADLGQRSALAAVAGADDPGAAWLALDVHQAAEVVEAICIVTITGSGRRGSVFDPDTVDVDFDI